MKRQPKRKALTGKDESFVVVGGGSAGLSTALHLARRGCRPVDVVEADGLFQGSSIRSASILLTLGKDPVTRELAVRTSAALDELARRAGVAPLVDRRGVLLAAPPGREDLLDRILETGDDSGDGSRSVRELGSREILTLVPRLRRPPARAVLGEQDGIVDLVRLARTLEQELREAGVRLRVGTSVTDLLVEDGRVAGVRLAGGEELRAHRTLLAAGGWASRLGARAGSRIRLTATRRHLAVSVPVPEVDPAWPVYWLLGEEEFYFRPVRGEGALLLCACDETPVEDPDHLELDDSVLTRIRELAAEHLALELPERVARFWCGMRTFAPDRRFLAGPDPDLEDLLWVAGLGGAGISTGLEVGRIAAARALGEPLDDPVARALDPLRLVEALV